MQSSPPTTWAEVPSAVRVALAAARTKLAEGGLPVVAPAADVLGWRAGPLNAHWGGPRPLTNTLIGAGLGALLGGSGGWLAEQFFPEGTFQPGGPRKRLAVLGAGVGALPGLYQAYDNLRAGQGVADAWPPPADPTPAHSALAGSPVAAVLAGKEAADPFFPVIHRDRFQQAVFADPFTPPNVQAGAAGLVEAASAVRGLPVVTPWDVARIAVGGGSGLASGYLTGKVFGVLAGLTPERQRDLQQAGLWAGVLKAVVPQALGFKS
jgi:hypothetical protein